MTLPLNDYDLLVYVREILAGTVRSPHVRMLRNTSAGAGRDFVTGDMIRDEFIERAGLVYHEAGHVPPPRSWTAALHRLSREGKLIRLPLYGPRGAKRGYGYKVPS